MRLIELLQGNEVLAPPAADPEIAGITRDSRDVRRGYVFVAIPGTRLDGRAYLADAIARGAAAAVFEPPAPDPPPPVPWALVGDARLALASMSRAFFGDPSASLLVAGITGTNGKTTTAYLLASILDAAGMAAGLLGTVEYQTGGAVQTSPLTTPESTDVQRMMREMVDAGRKACVLEASSHGLDQRRLDGVRFTLGIFTNLDRDHLDYHAGLEEYIRAKARLFAMLPGGATAVLNAEDEASGRMQQVTRARVVTYGVEGAPDYRLAAPRFTAEGTRAVIESASGKFAVESRLVGRFNGWNILAASASAAAIGVAPEAIAAGIGAVGRVAGRLEPVDAGQPFRVYVDFAHTAHALGSCMESLRYLAPKRLIVVFGAGGDRDPGRRVAMGEKAAELADLAVITSDNPRSEDPFAIVRQIETAYCEAGGPNSMVIPDRREAIRRAIRQARPGDFVLIAGKGHETHQLVGDERIPMDDRIEARQALAEIGYQVESP